jgi:hypothetical protein
MVEWMESYNDSTICDVIENHWLTLDDDDGNILNGTPHSTAIDQGFRDQGFPGMTFNDCSAPSTYGMGTPGKYNAVPQISSVNDPKINSSNFTLHGGNTETGLAGFLAVGFSPANLSYGATHILVNILGPHVLAPITTIGLDLPGFGYVDVTGPIPDEPDLDGLHIYTQFLFFDSGAQSGLSATEGLDVKFCK